MGEVYPGLVFVWQKSSVDLPGF